MTIIKGFKTGWHNSTSKIGEWSVPQEIGDDRPRGNKTYGSFEMTKGLSFNGLIIEDGGFELSYQSGKLFLTAGKATILGHLFELEESLNLTDDFTSARQIVLGINRNSDERNTYLKFEDTISNTQTQEELTSDSGVYEVILWQFKEGYNSSWVRTFPMSTTISDYLDTTLIETSSKNIYDIEVSSIPDNLISNPSEFNWEILTLKLLFNNLGSKENKNIIRIRKSNSFLEVEFDEYSPIIGTNTIRVYFDEDGKLKATIGEKR